MEFRYRANDRDRPPPLMGTAPSQFPNPNSSLMPVLGSSEVHVRDAIQREIEKEQIRQEIIIAEAARKRELLGEVLQEMAMEREMAKRSLTGTGMLLEEKLTMLINNQTKVPNQIQSHNSNLFRHIDPLINIGSYKSLVSSSSMMQVPPLQQTHEATRTSILEPYKERLIVLERADSVGEKRKADTQTGLERAKRIAADGVGVDLSKISIMEPNKERLIVLERTDSVGEKPKAEDTQNGLERAKHIAADGVGVGFSSVSTQLLGSTVGGLNEDLHWKMISADAPTLKEKPMSAKTKGLEGKRKSCFKFWCDICKVGAYSPRVMRNHELGKKHMAALTQQNEPPAQQSEPPETDSTSEAITVLKNGQKRVLFLCKICNVKTNSEQMMESHKAGKKHKAMFEHKLRRL